MATTPIRRELPDEGQPLEYMFKKGNYDVGLFVWTYQDGTPGRISVEIAPATWMISGFADAFAEAISFLLQYGVPLQEIAEKFGNVRLDVSETTVDQRVVQVIISRIFNLLVIRFPPNQEVPPEPVPVASNADLPQTTLLPDPHAPPCPRCRYKKMVAKKEAYECPRCGNALPRT